jgi:hypothetical protein
MNGKRVFKHAVTMGTPLPPATARPCVDRGFQVDRRTFMFVGPSLRRCLAHMIEVSRDTKWREWLGPVGVSARRRGQFASPGRARGTR